MGRRSTSCLAFLLAFGGLSLSPVVLCAAGQGDGSSSEGRRHTLLERRFENIVRQELDYSCGAAAVSTLLSYYYDDPTSEREVLKLIDRTLTEGEKIERTMSGFSLLDLKHAVSEIGYDADGYRLSFEQLRQLAAPVIVYVEPLGYHHFAVLRGVVGDRVFLADPSRGNLRMSVGRFQREWGGIAFVLGRAGEADIGQHPLSVSDARDALTDRRRIQHGFESERRMNYRPRRIPPGLFSPLP